MKWNRSQTVKLRLVCPGTLLPIQLKNGFAPYTLTSLYLTLSKLLASLPAIPIIGLPARLANGLEQRWLRLLTCHLKTINIRKGKGRSVATGGFSNERERPGYSKSI